MKINEMKEDPLIIEWLDTINAKPTTENIYLLGMQVYTEWIKKNPDELLTEAEEEIKSGILPRQRNIKKCFVGFRKYLQDKGLAPLTVKSYLSGIKSFIALLI